MAVVLSSGIYDDLTKITYQNTPLLYNEYLYINTAQVIYRYDYINKTLTTLYNKTTSTSHYAVLYNGIMYIVRTGGYTGLYIHMYNIDTGEYSMAGSYTLNSTYNKEAPIIGGVFIDDGYIYVTVSNYSYKTFPSTSYAVYLGQIRYSINDNTWLLGNMYSTTGGGYSYMKPAAARMRGQFLNNNGITQYVFNSDSANNSGSVTYNKTKGICTYTFPTLSPVTQITPDVHFSDYALIYINGLYYVISGYINNIVSPNVYAYNPDTHVLTEMAFSMPYAFYNRYAVQLNDMYLFFTSDGVLRITATDYNITYDIKSRDGQTVYATHTGCSPATGVRFGVTDNTVSYIINTISGDITGTYTTDPPENYKLNGYAFTINPRKPILSINTDISVSLSVNTTFYESYIKYVLPLTMFDINTYQNTAETARVDKTEFLSAIGTLRGALRAECSLIRPSITFEQTTVPTFNYVYIGVFNRYYFVTGLTSVTYGLWRMELNVDVLMSYSTEIKNLNCIIARQENAYNDYLIDNELPTEKKVSTEVIEISNDILSTQLDGTAHTFVLNVIGA